MSTPKGNAARDYKLRGEAGECEVNRESKKAVKPPPSHFQNSAYALRGASNLPFAP